MLCCRHPRRRSLRQQDQDTINGQPVVEVTFRNKCADQGLNFRYSFSFDGEYAWFSEKVTNRIPAIFTDYLCAWEPVSPSVVPQVLGFRSCAGGAARSPLNAAGWSLMQASAPTCVQVNYQFAAPDNRLDDPAVQEAIRNGTCFNDQVLLRWPGWKGHGPQSDFSFE